MDDNSDNAHTAGFGLRKEPAGGDMQSSYKPRGFGRGKPLAQNVDDGSDKQQRNGFGSRPAGGFGKAQGGFGSRTSNGTGGEKESFGGAFANSSTSRGGFASNEDAPRGGGFSKAGSGCQKCGDGGHFARECPKDSSGGSSSGCRKCGEEGHFARNCPTGGGEGGSGCRKCGEEGHFARNCPIGGGGGGSGCRKCGEEGHFARNCPTGGGEGGSGCRKCGEEGHFARDCPKGGGFSNVSGSGCHKCGEEGHYSRDCPSGGGEKPREIYIPPEVTSDENLLFKSSIQMGINFDKYDNISVEVTGIDPPKAIATFEEANLLPTFLQNVKRTKYVKPTPIQRYAIPAILSGRDLMGCAQTGSGKTAAFILPVLTSMVQEGLTTSKFSQVQEPQAVIVAPTRELAIQIYTEACKFAYRTDIRPVVVYGGTSVVYQLRQVEQGANIIVGTPGRLLDFIQKGKISLEKVQYLILDEADRMLDMGFEPLVRQLVETLGLPPKTKRHTLMFSATFKAEIQKLAADFLKDNYLFITVGIVGGACKDVEQTFFEVDRLKKREQLCDILNNSGTDKILVFVGQKRNADFLASYLSQSGYPTTSIHGDRLQREREEALQDFSSGKAPVLIATNVAARGLDIPDVKHVINYDLPLDIDEYVHRIGRTGRCGNLGKATSFYFHDTDFALAPSLARILKEANQVVPDWLDEYASGIRGDFSGSSGQFASKDIRHKGKFGSGIADKESSFNIAGRGSNDDESWD